MRRFVMSGLGIGLAVVALGMSGCGGGIEQGIPKDTTLQPIPANVQTRMGPPPKRMPTPRKAGILRGPVPAWKVRAMA
jgi:hypothetical protein